MRMIFFLNCLWVGTFVWHTDAAAQNSVKPEASNVTQHAPANPVVTGGLSKDQFPSRDSTALQETKKLLPKLGQSETTHYVILSDAGSSKIIEVGKLLESTFDKYLEVCNLLGLQPRPLRHKLVAVFFSEEIDYKTFAAQHDKVDKNWAVGYYSPLADRLVFYEPQSEELIKKAQSQLDEQEHRLQMTEQLQQAQGNALRPNPQLNHAKNQVAAEQSRIEDLTAGNFVSTTVHEAAHQLFFHTDIQRNGVSYPMWLAEGLATNFETETTEIRFGYQVDNWNRRDAFKLASAKNSIIPLELLLTKDRFADGTESTEAIGFFYAQAYVFTNWLLRERPTELCLYLKALLDGSFIDAKSRKAEFELIFGPLQRLERNWVRYEGRREPHFLLSPYSKRVLAKISSSPVVSNPQPTPAPQPPDTTPASTAPQSKSQSTPLPPK